MATSDSSTSNSLAVAPSKVIIRPAKFTPRENASSSSSSSYSTGAINAGASTSAVSFDNEMPLQQITEVSSFSEVKKRMSMGSAGGSVDIDAEKEYMPCGQVTVVSSLSEVKKRMSMGSAGGNVDAEMKELPLAQITVAANLNEGKKKMSTESAGDSVDVDAKKKEMPVKQVTVVSSLSKVKKKMSTGSVAKRVDLGATNTSGQPPFELWREQYETFLQIFPDADPSYLKEMSLCLCGKEEEIRVFVADTLEKQNYPRVKGEYQLHLFFNSHLHTVCISFIQLEVFCNSHAPHFF